MLRGRMAIRRSIKELSPSHLLSWLQENGMLFNCRKQLTGWLYRKDVKDFGEMTDLPKTLREELANHFSLWSLQERGREEGPDGTVKFVWIAEDGEHVESALIPERGRLTLCISSQIGCRMGCRFCLTGQQGFKRNLSKAEILDQVLLVRREVRARGQEVTNVVFMGMGEPLSNYEECLAAWKALVSDEELGLSHRRVTLSTVGLVPQLRRVAKEEPNLSLALSLNATDDETRSWIMPINQRYPLREVMAALREYPLCPRKRIILEYVVLKEVNHYREDASRLAELVRSIRVKVNLIPFNPFPGAPFERPSDEEVLRFQSQLRDKGISAFIRKSRGQEISAACGLLRWRLLTE